MEATLKKAASCLRDARVPYLLGGSLACWVRGGPESRKDLDFMVKSEDAERALAALADAGIVLSARPRTGSSRLGTERSWWT